ncbi:hypothetical protein J2Z50_002398 [Ensifer mexicanus]|nr:hypothetical protein [Sinorhizobium mexicanum]
MKKAVKADELARFVKADQVAYPAEQRNIGDALVSAHHPVAARKPFIEDAEQSRRGAARLQRRGSYHLTANNRRT